jgi:hypothetical protein
MKPSQLPSTRTSNTSAAARRIRPHDAADHGDGCGLAGADWAQQADGLARRNGETDGIHGQAIAVALGKTFNLQHQRHPDGIGCRWAENLNRILDSRAPTLTTAARAPPNRGPIGRPHRSRRWGENASVPGIPGSALPATPLLAAKAAGGADSSVLALRDELILVRLLEECCVNIRKLPLHIA